MSGRDLPCSSEALTREATASAYRRFAETEARGHSPLYEALALRVAGDDEVLRFLQTLPRGKRQPNLLLAAVRHHRGGPAEWRDFRHTLLADNDAIRRLMLSHSTQTNEPARCATLLPALAALPQPLALIEVGSSAGLCLLPDFYGYDYGRLQLAPAAPVVFPCVASAGTTLPRALPQIAWRAGLDIHPLSVSQPHHRAWLEALVWPEQTARLERLRGAFAIAEVVQPRVVAGDLRRDLPQLAAEAPADATLVVFHTAAVAYVAAAAERQAFADTVRRLGARWIANEPPATFPDIARRAGMPRQGFLLSTDGLPMAWTDPHGASIDWIA